MFDHFTPPERPALDRLATLVDVTLRDGGFEVDFHWPTELFAAVPRALGPLGVEIVELGYIGGVPLEHDVAEPGIGAHLTPAMVAAASAAADGAGPKLAAMIHPTALGREINLMAYRAAGLGMVRLVYHPDWSREIARIADLAQDAGLAVTVNLALASRYETGELVDHARRICQSAEPDVLYIADTCGAFDPQTAGRACAALREAVETPLGFHAHDFLTLGYANALTAVEQGASYVDCSLLGLGRGGGNLQSELMLAKHRIGAGPAPAPAAEAFARLEGCRARLAELARRPGPDVVAIACGALNLTPVEETALRAFAEDTGIAVAEAAWGLLAADDFAAACALLKAAS